MIRPVAGRGVVDDKGATMLPPLAHAGQRIIDVAFALPFAGLLMFLILTTLREGRRASREGGREGRGPYPFAILERRPRA